MSKDLSPEAILGQLETPDLGPYYLFHGPSDFLKENTIAKVKRKILDPATADFNLQVFYADETTPGQVLEAACSVPFMADRRIVIVRRTESYRKSDQERFLPYLDNPATSTCLLLVASTVDFRQPLFARIRKKGRSVFFAPLKEARIIPWLRSTAREMGLDISPEACAYLYQIVGSSLMELYGELEKLSVRYGKSPVGIEQVKEMAAKTRAHSIFELMNYISEKDPGKALNVLHKLLAQGGREAALRILGMLNRQLRLLWQVKAMRERGKERDIPTALGIPPFFARRLRDQGDGWTEAELREFLESLCLADTRLKSGSREDIILDHLIMSLCKGEAQEEI
ncbi:MAG: DNA polymerase III subunit delta [Deltaproteobacteria bacterium]|nr:DNA polymerase III subunit delta [Deltaproteobacteria bacterium]MBW2081492.1 DNA polymerase III subunit delta [Deltaproteobacteria bacterium]